MLMSIHFNQIDNATLDISTKKGKNIENSGKYSFNTSKNMLCVFGTSAATCTSSIFNEFLSSHSPLSFSTRLSFSQLLQQIRLICLLIQKCSNFMKWWNYVKYIFYSLFVSMSSFIWMCILNGIPCYRLWSECLCLQCIKKINDTLNRFVTAFIINRMQISDSVFRTQTDSQFR